MFFPPGLVETACVPGLEKGHRTLSSSTVVHETCQQLIKIYLRVSLAIDSIG